MEVNETPIETPLKENPKTPQFTQPKVNVEKMIVEQVIKKNFVSYVAAGAYGFWETMRAMQPQIAPMVGLVSQELTKPRAQEGIQKILEQHTGDGTIVALGFFGGEAVLQTIDIIGKKLGKKGIDPEIRFLSSLTFGVAAATYLETTTIMNNTVDIPGDLLGVAFGAAAILSGKIAEKHVTKENLVRIVEKGKSTTKDVLERLRQFGQKLGEILKKKDDQSLDPEVLATEYVNIVGGENNQSPNFLNKNL